MLPSRLESSPLIWIVQIHGFCTWTSATFTSKSSRKPMNGD